MDQETNEKRRKFRLSCSSLIGVGFLLVLICCISSIIFLVSKPEGIWGSVVNFLNNGQTLPTQTPYTAEEAIEFIDKQITQIGENTIIVPEDYIPPILNKYVPNLKQSGVNIEKDILKINWILDEKGEEPLLGNAEVKVRNSKDVYISKIGLERVGLPESVISRISGAIESYINSQSALDTIFSDKNLEVKEVHLEANQLRVIVNVNVKIFND